MANTHIVFGKIKNSYNIDALSFKSETIANNAVSTTSDANLNFCTVTAIGGATWVAFAPASGTANAANTSARVYIPANASMTFGVNGSVKIHTLDA